MRSSDTARILALIGSVNSTATVGKFIPRLVNTTLPDLANSFSCGGSGRLKAHLLFRFQTQLATSRIDVVALFPAQRCRYFLFLKMEQKFLLLRFRWAFPGQTLYAVVRNQVHFGVQTVGEAGQGLDLIQAVVHAGNENVLQRNHSSLPLLIILARGG